jgi:all-trans-retinol dehydrogenase (NAD+)
VSDVLGKNVLVTGGASGIGRRVARELARLGARVVVWDIDAGGLDRTVAELASDCEGRGRGYVCDVSQRESVYDTARRVRQDVGPIQIVVNCAGIVSGKRFLDLSDSDIERTFQVNTLALFWIAKAFLPEMMAAGSGHFVTVASAGGLIGVAGLVDYCASKWGAIGLDESLRVELKQQSPGVKTTIVCPYFVDTGMFHGVATRFPLLLPILSEAYVAERIVWGIRRDKRRLWMPRLVYWVPLLRMLPPNVFDALANWLGINAAMRSFQGRSETREQVQG